MGNRCREISTRLVADLQTVLGEAGVTGEQIAIDRVDLELVLAFQREKIQLIDGKPIMERARSVKSLVEIEMR